MNNPAYINLDLVSLGIRSGFFPVPNDGSDELFKQFNNLKYIMINNKRVYVRNDFDESKYGDNDLGKILGYFCGDTENWGVATFVRYIVKFYANNIDLYTEVCSEIDTTLEDVENEYKRRIEIYKSITNKYKFSYNIKVELSNTSDNVDNRISNIFRNILPVINKCYRNINRTIEEKIKLLDSISYREFKEFHLKHNYELIRINYRLIDSYILLKLFSQDEEMYDYIENYYNLK